MLVLNLPFKALMFLTLMRPSLVLFLVLWLKLVKDFLKDRKSGSAGMPRPMSYAVFCLKKKTVETMRRCGHSSRKSAAKWAAKRHPGLEQLITERGVHRSDDIETAIISWCEDFSSRKIPNEAAARAYSVGLDKLKAWAPNCNSDQMQGEADRLLQEAVALLCSEPR